MYLTKEEIKKIVNAKLQNKWAVDQNYYLGFSDKKYYLPSLKEMKQYLTYYPVKIDSLNTIAGTEGFDCDDFSFSLKGNIIQFNRNIAKKNHSWAVGIIWGNFDWINEFHAANWIFTSERELYLIEPQNNQFHDFEKCKGNVQLVIL